MSSSYMIIKFGRHDSEDVHITTLVMLVTGNRTKNAQGSDAKPFPKVIGMAPD